MYPATLDVRNRDDQLVRAPIWRKYPSERHPNQSDFQDACFYEAEHYQTREKTVKNTVIWVAEFVMIVAIFLLFLTIIIWFPPLHYFSEAHGQLKKLHKDNDTLLSDFPQISKTLVKHIIFPYNFFLYTAYALIGFAPVILCVSSWNVGNRSTNDVVYRNVVIHLATLFTVILVIFSFVFLLSSWIFLTVPELRDVIVKMQHMQAVSGVSHNQTFLGKIELKKKCCGINHPLDYWSLNKEKDEWVFGISWFKECSESLKKPFKACRFPESCKIFSVPQVKYLKPSKFETFGNIKGWKALRNYYVDQRGNWTDLVDKNHVGCQKKVFFNYFFYIFTFIELIVIIVCCSIVVVLLTCAATSRKEQRIVNEIYRGREDRIAWEAFRIQRQAKRATEAHKNMLLKTHVLEFDRQPESSTVNAEV
uniref:Tetraspanin n=1 Tax=Panagrellus redivivus TaxID=6233 RepID=A0A7E4VJ76_PANRE